MTRILLSFNSSSPAAPETAATESDFVVILAGILCALISMLGLLAVARCAWLRRINDSSSWPAASAAGNKGLKKKVLRSLPKFTYVDGADGNGNSSIDCAICLTEYANGDQVREMPHCGHRFHVECIDKWLAAHSSCPSCRQLLVVGRCRKCGEFPTALSSAGAPPIAPPSLPTETELKDRQTDAGGSSGFLP